MKEQNEVYKCYRYTGDIKLLKSLGYTFHKLYANNYKCYNQDDLWLFVKNGMVVECNQLAHPNEWFTVVKFILDNKNKPLDFWNRKSTHPMFKDTVFAEHRIIDGVVYNHKAKWDKAKQERENGNDLWQHKDGFAISSDLVFQILTLNQVGKLQEGVI